MEKVMIPLMNNDVAPRFDLATDVLIVNIARETYAMGKVVEKVVVLDNPSSEAMCRLALSEDVTAVICAGIEGEYYDFLEWKGAKVLDDICGPVDTILEAYLAGSLTPGACFY